MNWTLYALALDLISEPIPDPPTQPEQLALAGAVALGVALAALLAFRRRKGEPKKEE